MYRKHRYFQRNAWAMCGSMPVIRCLLFLAGCTWLACSTSALAGNGNVVWLWGTDPDLYLPLEGREAVTVTNKGVVATITTSGGDLRHTRTVGLSVQSGGETELKGMSPGEFIDFSFDQPVMFKAYFVGSWSKKYGDEAVISLNGSEMAVITSTGYHEVEPFFVPAGWVLRFQGTSGSSPERRQGWSLTSFTTSRP